MSKPNILWIMTDQFRADALSCAGGPGATPNLDALAREGVRFSNCSTVAPLWGCERTKSSSAAPFCTKKETEVSHFAKLRMPQDAAVPYFFTRYV